MHVYERVSAWDERVSKYIFFFWWAAKPTQSQIIFFPYTRHPTTPDASTGTPHASTEGTSLLLRRRSANGFATTNRRYRQPPSGLTATQWLGKIRTALAPLFLIFCKMKPEFNFFQHWYPLSPVEDLDPKQPTAVTLLGLRLVIWKPKSSETFQVFLDQCPHRLAPLSEGRIDDKTGNLMCSYHGWQFDEQGICTHIPQAENPELVSNNQKNLCAVGLPVRQQQDLLWVWADAKSREQAANTPLPLSPQVDASKGFVWTSFVRDLEYDWQTLVENVADPSHVPFSHHGVQGDV